jgi:hypothetical protein
MRVPWAIVIASLGLAASVPPLLAHHSILKEYDSAKTLTLKGVITSVEWVNPHVHFFIDVEENGRTVNWKVELGAPNSLVKTGLPRNALKPSDEVSTDVWIARDGDRTAFARTLTLADGRRLVDTGPQMWLGKNPN